ncbi:MAG: 2Fe-2S iron-sulfur cluster-binding protein [Rubrivivax sp.]|nr:2Fe-2S iron-sulfur cluster-binding protein [Rubrivivax sp.]MDH5339577.1 2Fe-2S iron-sulfur cluster-binding protein [Rubrivivax sp.]
MNSVTAQLIEPDGRATTVRARPGTSLMRAATDAGIEGIAADCGGCLSCATCHVYVAPEWLAALPPPDADERAMLELTAAEPRPESRLSCQIVLTSALDGLRVQLPPTQY